MFDGISGRLVLESPVFRHFAVRFDSKQRDWFGCEGFQLLLLSADFLKLLSLF